MSEPTTEDVIAKGLALRDEIEAMKKRHTAEILPYENALKACETWLLQVMQQRKETNIKTKFGTAFQSPQMRTTMEDRAALLEFVLEDVYSAAIEHAAERDWMAMIGKIKARLGFFTNHVAKDQVKDYIEAGTRTINGLVIDGPAPPGIKVDKFTDCHIRKA